YIPRIDIPGIDADLELALELADVADQITMRRFRAGDLTVHTKPDLTPVSDADRAVEADIRTVLGRVRPGDVVIGEEEAGPRGGADDVVPQDDTGRCWIIDPIDGTKGFVRGIPVWATLIALAVGGELVVGVASAPAIATRWWARRGNGCFRNG